MSKLQSQKIKEAQSIIKDFQERLEFKCFDCEGQTRHGGGWDCQMDNCSFYGIRPRSVFFGKSIPARFRASVFSADDIEPKKY